jgi:hypothetical protein
LFNIQFLCVSPEQFQIVVVAVFVVKDVNYNIDKIQQNPAGLILACPAETLQALFSRRLADFIGHGTHLPVACAGRDYKIVGGGRFAL